MELLDAVIATGVSKVVAKSRLAKLDDKARAELKKMLPKPAYETDEKTDEKKRLFDSLPKGFDHALRLAFVESEKTEAVKEKTKQPKQA